MQFLCVCSAFRLVVEKLEVPVTERLNTLLDHMQFLEHVPRPQPLDTTISDFREELSQILFELQPDAIYRRWLRARVANIGHNVQTPEERDYATIQEFNSKMIWEGFEPIFLGEYGAKLPEVLNALERVGASETQELLQEAMDHLGRPFPTTRAKRRKAWNSQASRKMEKNDWELDLDDLYSRYCDLDECCMDVAARRAVVAYRERGMSVPPEVPAKTR